MRNRFGTPETVSRVRHYVAGGTEHGGGIGRLISYILDSASVNEHRVTDTRGPRWDKLRSPMALLTAVATMVGDRVLAPDRVHHIHIAGRGSTARKLILGRVARGLGCTYVVHLHDFDYAADFSRRTDGQKRAIRCLFRGADLVVVLGNRDRDTVTGLLQVPQALVRVLHNAVPDPKRHQPTRSRAATDPVVIVFLGQLGPRKGVPELLQALAHPVMAVAEGQPGWRAVLAGDGPVEAYRADVAQLGLSDRVTLTGWLGKDQTRALCEAADILVLPSHAEGMAMAVLEGLAHALTVVTTPVGAHREVLTDGETCVFVPVADPEALAGTLAHLIAHPELRRKIAAAGRAHYTSTLSIEAYMAKLDALHLSLGPRAREDLPFETGAS